jgi:hypothetical protein
MNLNEQMNKRLSNPDNTDNEEPSTGKKRPAPKCFNGLQSSVPFQHRSPATMPSNPNRSLLTPSLGINRALPTHLPRLDLFLHLRSLDAITGVDQTLHQEWPANYGYHRQ